MGRQQVNFAATAVAGATMGFLSLGAPSRDAAPGLPPPRPTPRPGARASIRVEAGATGRPVGRYLPGACIEDVNHEIYGGIYSQMIFGESFQEPPHTEPAKGFWSPDGSWQVREGEVHGDGGPGPKLIS